MPEPENTEEPEIDEATRKELGISSEEELTQELLQTKLAEYQLAIKQEFESDVKGVNADSDVKAITQNFFRDNVPAAAAQIVWLANHSSSDSVRGSMSKYIIEAAFNEEKDSGDPIKDLLRELSGNDPKPAKKEAEH